MTRWRASAIHLGLSALVIGSVFLAVLALWYPPALLPMSGVLGLIALIAIVDVCLGPLLTLVVYRRGKPSLRFDLAVVVALQLSMLGYGLHVLAQNRPVFMVATPDRLVLIRAFEIEPDDLAAGSAAHRRLSWTGPTWVGARIPTRLEQRDQSLPVPLSERPLHMQPRYYLEFEQVRPELLTQARPISHLLNRLNQAERQRLDSALGSTPTNGLRFLTLDSSRGAALILVDRDGEMGRIVAIDPHRVQAQPERLSAGAGGAATSPPLI